MSPHSFYGSNDKPNLYSASVLPGEPVSLKGPLTEHGWWLLAGMQGPPEQHTEKFDHTWRMAPP